MKHLLRRTIYSSICILKLFKGELKFNNRMINDSTKFQFIDPFYQIPPILLLHPNHLHFVDDRGDMRVALAQRAVNPVAFHAGAVG